MGVNQSAKRKHHIGENEEVNFDHFQILRVIGKGSFGKVCIVRKKDTEQLYAMKYMSKPVCLEKDALQNVLREIEILTQLDHPFLVNLWFSFHDEEDVFLVQDLLLGGDLRYHLLQNVQFPLESVKMYIAEIALALDYLKSKRIIHRDVKPDNLLLNEDGHAHLTDFNVATVLGDNELATSLSGTKPYMAPEIYNSTELGYDFDVDWWSLGVVAYELSTGRRPFEIHSHSQNKEIRQILQKTPDWPDSWTEEFSTVVKKFLTFNPKERLTCLEDLQALMKIDYEQVLEKKIVPIFKPLKGHLNCDPTFELEEMIVESKPLHKKKKRLAKQKSLRESGIQTPGSSEQEFKLDPLAEEFTIFNRQKELDRQERERKEQEWEEELLRAMGMSPSESSTSSTERDKMRFSKKVPSADSTTNISNIASGSDMQGSASSSAEAVASTSSKSSSKNGHNSPSSKKSSQISTTKDPKLQPSFSPGSRKSVWSASRSTTLPENSINWSNFPKS